MKNRRIQLLVIALAAAGWAALTALEPERQWLAGDSHIHSHWSADYDETKNPPEPIVGVDGRYATPINAHRARMHGLSWMVTTDHGGPNHSKLNLTRAYAELKASREMVPEVLQFYGMELNMPAMDHHTLIIPNGEREASMLSDIESRFDAQEAWPADPSRNTEAQAQRALEHMKSLPLLPLLFANHPSRSAKGRGRLWLNEPRELRANNVAAPEVYRGMEGAPGHQAGGLAPDGSQKKDAAGRPAGHRGGYSSGGAPTFGGFDQMTAIVGGLWDSLLGEGRRFWIRGDVGLACALRGRRAAGLGFLARRIPEDLRARVAELSRRARRAAQRPHLRRGGRSHHRAGHAGQVRPRGRPASARRSSPKRDNRSPSRSRSAIPTAKNAHGDNPRVSRVDVIIGDMRGASEDPNVDRNPTTKVIARFSERQWTRDGDTSTFLTTLPASDRNFYVRVRGTNTHGRRAAYGRCRRNPWADLWFYSNPIFVEFGN